MWSRPKYKGPLTGKPGVERQFMTHHPKTVDRGLRRGPWESRRKDFGQLLGQRSNDCIKGALENTRGTEDRRRWGEPPASTFLFLSISLFLLLASTYIRDNALSPPVSFGIIFFFQDYGNAFFCFLASSSLLWYYPVLFKTNSLIGILCGFFGNI